jgi:hypothetical protein
LARYRKKESPKQSMVTAVTEFIRRGLHNDPAMARRSFGVVLIVALMGWTVNQPMQCEGQHSRAAVVVLAGASPAYQPEPSPTRHSCCPRESHHAAVSPRRIPRCHPHSTSDCCSLSKESQGGLPPGLTKDSASPYYGLASLSVSRPIGAFPQPASAVAFQGSSRLAVPAFAVLRL